VSKENGLVIGCGERGLDWASQQDSPLLCLDNDPDLPDTPFFIRGDVLSLDSFGLGPADRIHADFFLNAVFPQGVIFKDVIADPTILQEPPFPTLVRNWYQQIFRFLDEPVTDHLKEIRWLIRTTALQQMWGVLAEGGEMIIIDKRDVIDWILDSGQELLGVDSGSIRITPSQITPADHERSNSRGLKLISQYPNRVRKVVVNKLRL